MVGVVNHSDISNDMYFYIDVVSHVECIINRLDQTNIFVVSKSYTAAFECAKNCGLRSLNLLFAFVVKLAKIAYNPYYFLSYIMIVSLYQHLLCEIGLFSLSDGMSDMCFSNAILSRLCYTSILHPVKQFLYYKSNYMTYDDK